MRLWSLAAAAAVLWLGLAGGAAAQSGEALCTPGARVQAWVGTTWYNATVLEATAEGCRLTYDGYSSNADGVVAYGDLRGGAAPPPSAEGPGGPLPDGRYICRKLTAGGGGLRDVGVLTVQGGQPYMSLPEGWTVESVSLAPGDGGETLIRVYYRSEGYRDEMDCTVD